MDGEHNREPGPGRKSEADMKFKTSVRWGSELSVTEIGIESKTGIEIDIDRYKSTVECDGRHRRAAVAARTAAAASRRLLGLPGGGCGGSGDEIAILAGSIPALNNSDRRASRA